MVTLTNTPFTIGHVPAFEALSYTWGSPENPIDIFINQSRGGFSILSVTKNLGDALPYLRFEDRDRVLWIDAICVNQQDLEERSQQVKRMAEIYSKAARVVAWLGPSSERTPVAMRCFDKISSTVKGDWLGWKLHALSEDASWADEMVAAPFNDQEYLAMFEYLSSEWFERLWIYQEIRLSSLDSILLCGHYSILWESFRSTAYFLYRKIYWAMPSEIFLQRLGIIRDLCNYTTYAPLINLLDQTNDCKCSDPRDRIFALLLLTAKSMRGYFYGRIVVSR